jgi:hypothetical protein
MKFHPLADVVPVADGISIDELAADIKAHGLRRPIVKYEGKILDGHAR